MTKHLKNGFGTCEFRLVEPFSKATRALAAGHSACHECAVPYDQDEKSVRESHSHAANCCDCIKSNHKKLKWLVELQRIWQAMIGARSPRPWSLTKIPFSLQGSMLHFTWLGCFNIILQVILWEFKEPRDVIFLGVNWDTTYYHVSMRVGAMYLELNTPQKLLEPMALKRGRSRWGKFGTL